MMISYQELVRTFPNTGLKMVELSSIFRLTLPVSEVTLRFILLVYP